MMDIDEMAKAAAQPKIVYKDCLLPEGIAEQLRDYEDHMAERVGYIARKLVETCANCETYEARVRREERRRRRVYLSTTDVLAVETDPYQLTCAACRKQQIADLAGGRE